MEDGTVLIITDRAGFYWYKPDEHVMDDVTVTWFDETFDSFIERAAYRDGKLYIKFNKNDYVTCFSMKPRVDETFAGKITFRHAGLSPADEEAAAAFSLSVHGNSSWSYLS